MKNAIGLFVALAAATLPARAAEWQEISGSRSNITQFRAVEIRTQQEWQALWREHAGDASKAPELGAGETVVGVFLGLQRTGAVSVELAVEADQASQGAVVVRPVVRGAPGGGVATTQLTTPFVLRKLQGQARFDEGTVQEAKERAERDQVGQAAARARKILQAIPFSTKSEDDPAGASFDGRAGTGWSKPESGERSVDAVHASGSRPSGMALAQLPPPNPGGQGKDKDKPLPPPNPGQGGGGALPPPNPGQGGGQLPPPNPGGDGKPLPPPVSRPSGPPRLPPPGDAEYDGGRVDTASYWRVRHDYYGRPITDRGSWHQTTDTGYLDRGGREVGTQGTHYKVELKSRSQRNVYILYYRYIGRDCDPNDTDLCRYWDIQHRWFLDDVEYGQTRFMTVEVEFVNDKELLPWEKERFSIGYDGGQVNLRQSDTAYGYSVSGPFIDQQRGVASFRLSAGNRNLRAPESNKVNAYLSLEGGQIKLNIEDSRAGIYAGEALEVAVVVKWDKPWSIFNPTVFERQQNGPIRIQVNPGQPKTVIDIPASSKGEYWIDSWSFKRAQSKISKGDWVWKGGGNKVVK